MKNIFRSHWSRGTPKFSSTPVFDIKNKECKDKYTKSHFT